MSEIMAPCYNNMKSLHYRTQSLPEAVYTNHMLSLQQQHHNQDHYSGLQLARQEKLHALSASSVIKKRSSNPLRRSQTNVADLVVPDCGTGARKGATNSMMPHHRAPLTAGLYEAFLPPPNFNAIGLPLPANCFSRPRPVASRAHSFYVPSSHHHTQQNQHLQVPVGHYPRLSQASVLGCGADSRLAGRYPLTTQHHQHRLVREFDGLHPGCHQQHHLNNSSSGLAASSQWYHRSVPNISQTGMQFPATSTSMTPSSSSMSSLTTPLFVDCSVEYDLGDQPPVPSNSEPLLAIHPEFVVKPRSVNSSPYSMYQSSSSHIRGGKVKSVASPPTRTTGGLAAINLGVNPQQYQKPFSDVIAAGYGRRLLHHHQQQQRLCVARRALIPRTNSKTSCVAGIAATPDVSSASSNLEATRKLSVESRDSGIGLMNVNNSSSVSKELLAVGSSSSTNNKRADQPWGMGSPADCDTPLVISSTADPFINCRETSNASVHQSHADYSNSKTLTSNKRFAFTDLVNGLLCCSTPFYGPDLNTSHSDEIPFRDWRSMSHTRAVHQTGQTGLLQNNANNNSGKIVRAETSCNQPVDKVSSGENPTIVDNSASVAVSGHCAENHKLSYQSLPNISSSNSNTGSCPGHSVSSIANNSNNWRLMDNRTVEWVMESQKMMMTNTAGSAVSSSSSLCRSGGGGLASSYCGQDCGDGFCYNVWNNMVHV